MIIVGFKQNSLEKSALATDRANSERSGHGAVQILVMDMLILIFSEVPHLLYQYVLEN